MPSKRNAYQLITLAATCGGLAVASGAFGAHALKSRLATAGMTDVWETAVFYHLMHAVAAMALGLAASAGGSVPAGALLRAGWCWLAGIGLFSGSLYGLALGGPRLLGPVTPLGGLFLIAGWALLAWAAWRQTRSTE